MLLFIDASAPQLRLVVKILARAPYTGPMRRFLLLVLPVLVACSSEGPTGPKGDPGPQGEPGTPGMPGMPGMNAVAKFYSAQESKMGIGPSTMETPLDVDATCDAGDVATGGDCLKIESGKEETINVWGHPIVTPPNAATGWSCHTIGYDAVELTATVLCASKD